MQIDNHLNCNSKAELRKAKKILEIQKAMNKKYYVAPKGFSFDFEKFKNKQKK